MVPWVSCGAMGFPRMVSMMTRTGDLRPGDNRTGDRRTAYTRTGDLRTGGPDGFHGDKDR